MLNEGGEKNRHTLNLLQQVKLGAEQGTCGGCLLFSDKEKGFHPLVLFSLVGTEIVERETVTLRQTHKKREHAPLKKRGNQSTNQQTKSTPPIDH